MTFRGNGKAFKTAPTIDNYFGFGNIVIVSRKLFTFNSRFNKASIFLGAIGKDLSGVPNREHVIPVCSSFVRLPPFVLSPSFLAGEPTFYSHLPPLYTASSGIILPAAMFYHGCWLSFFVLTGHIFFVKTGALI